MRNRTPEPMQSLGPLRKVFAKFGSDPHLGLAQHAFPDGSEAECPNCRFRRKVTTEEIAVFMRDGYPQCRRCSVKIVLLNPHLRRLDF